MLYKSRYIKANSRNAGKFNLPVYYYITRGKFQIYNWYKEYIYFLGKEAWSSPGVYVYTTYKIQFESLWLRSFNFAFSSVQVYEFFFYAG